MERQIKKEEEKSKKLNVSRLKRGFQWRPVPTILSTTMCFLISGVIFLVVGAVLVYMTSQVREFEVRYDNLTDCENSKVCEVEISIEETLEPPVMVYYQLENFYQDHRRYIKSKSIDQLGGKILSVSDITSNCDPIITVKDLGFSKTIGGEILNDTSAANPCGLIARSLFNDTYSLFTTGVNRMSIFINETDIAWDSDKRGRYKRSQNYSKIQWTDVENEHFMVWMRPAGLPDFRKLWGRINSKLESGRYILVINNNYPVAHFAGKKSFVVSTVSVLGGKNNFLGIAYLVVGCICLIMALLFWVGYKNYNSDKKLN